MLNHPRTGQRFDSPVPPGFGLPGDPATPAAGDAAQVAQLAGKTESVGELDALVSVCRA